MSKKKDITLRAFNIMVENTNVTSPTVEILPMLNKVLEDRNTTLARCMRLNEQDEDRDVLSWFNLENKTYMFGLMLRIMPNVNGALIDNEMLNQDSIKLEDLSTKDNTLHRQKWHFYVAINNTHLVTNLPGTLQISFFQTYLNWLLGEIRNEQYFAISPVVKEPKECPLSEIKSIEFNSGNPKAIETNPLPMKSQVVSMIKALTGDMLKHILDSSDEFDDIQKSELISASLLLKFNRKPKSMDKATYQKLMGAVAKHLSDDNGLIIRGKNGQKLTGKEIKETKNVRIDLTESGNISEPQLQQEMEIYLKELSTKE
ncbi:MAG: hypothetical protein LUD17_05010 [Bacteroidales bacterium]|nr:hypothetical protein [Bacteroidales bacterium]